MPYRMPRPITYAACVVLACLISACAGLLKSDSKDNAMTANTLPCPVLESGPADLSAEAPAKYVASRPMPLRQHWDDALPKETGVARIGATEEGLSVHVRFEDSDVFSTATANQQRMWTLGDVVEVFAKPGRDQSSYWEVHVTPNGFLMDLHIPSRAGMQSGEHSWEEMIAPESGTTYQVNVDDGGWSAELTIPWSAFDIDGRPEAGTVWQIAVCRYNYNGGLESHELSSTAPLTQASYHRYEEYTDLAF